MRKRLQARQVKEPTGSRVATDLYCQSRFRELPTKLGWGHSAMSPHCAGMDVVGVKKAAAMSVAGTGSCRTRARWPLTRELTRSVVPSGKASASWCWCGFSGLSLQNCATLKGIFLDPNQRPRYVTFCSNTNSVPGRRQTATRVSSALANPRVLVPRKSVETSVSPTLAGRDAMACIL